jgi:hypothetical protein
MFLPRGPGSWAVKVRMGGDLDVQVEGCTAALVIQTKPLQNIYTREAVQLLLLQILKFTRTAVQVARLH